MLATVLTVLAGGLDGCVFGCHVEQAENARGTAAAHCHSEAGTNGEVGWQAVTTCSHQHDASVAEAAPANRVAPSVQTIALAAVGGFAGHQPTSPALTIVEGPPDLSRPSLVPAFSVPLRL